MSEKRLNSEELNKVTGGNGVILVNDSDKSSFPSPQIPGEDILPLNPGTSASGKTAGLPNEEDEQIL